MPFTRKPTAKSEPQAPEKEWKLSALARALRGHVNSRYYLGNRPVVISISGMAGAGKTTLMQKLRSGINLPIHEISYRNLIDPNNPEMDSLDKVKERARTDPTVDFLLDEVGITKAHEFMRDKGGIVNGRMAAFLDHPGVAQILSRRLGRNVTPAPVHVKILLRVDPEVAGRRNYEREMERRAKGLPPQETFTSLEDAIERVRQRNERDITHYRATYGPGVHVFDPNAFHVVIDTDNLSPDQVYRRVLQEIRRGKPSRR